MNANKLRKVMPMTAMVVVGALLLQSCQKEDWGGSDAALSAGPTRTGQVNNLRTHEELNLDVNEILTEVRGRGAGALNLRLAGARTRDLEVMVKPAEADVELYVDDVQQPMPEIFTLTGFRRGTSEPCVITVAEGWFSAVFKENGEEYFVEARRNFDPAAASDQFVIYRAQDVIDPGPTACGGDHLHTDAHQHRDAADEDDRATCKKVKMTVVADPQFRDDYSSTANCLAAMTTQINNASYCYWNNTGLLLDLTVSKNYIYTSTTAFTSNNANTLLNQFRTWGNSSTSRRSNLNYLFTGRTLQDNVAGIAFTSVACSSPSNAYAVGMKMSTTAYWRNLIAHETGHNFSAPHHSSGIMQPMVTTSNTFSSSSKSTIQSFTNAHNCYTTGTCN